MIFTIIPTDKNKKEQKKERKEVIYFNPLFYLKLSYHFGSYATVIYHTKQFILQLNVGT